MEKKIVARIQGDYTGNETDRCVEMNPDDMRRHQIGQNWLAFLSPGKENLACHVVASDKVYPEHVVLPRHVKQALAKRVGGTVLMKLGGGPVAEVAAAGLEVVFVETPGVPNIDVLRDLAAATFAREIAPRGLFNDGETITFRVKRYFSSVTCKITTRSVTPAMVSAGASVTVTVDKLLLGLGQHPAGRGAWDAVGGLEPQIALLRRYVELPFKHPEVYRYLAINPPHGILLKGPPGTGKTLLAKTLAAACEATLLEIPASTIAKPLYGEAEAAVRDAFKKARASQPCIILCDDIDGLFPTRSDSSSGVEGRLLAELFSNLDAIRPDERIVVIGTTNLPEKLDAAARRPGRFDHEILIPAPDEAARRKIFECHLGRSPNLAGPGTALDTAELARLARGFSGADIMSAVRTAAYTAIQRHEARLRDNAEPLSGDELKLVRVTREDMVTAIASIKPSSLRGVEVEVQNVPWDAVGGLEEQKRQISETVSWMTTKREKARKIGIRLPKGILLHGPPGTGKTLIGKAIATQGNCNFIAVRGPELLSKWLGESEENVRSIFHLARTAAPCVVFFDEFDAIAGNRAASAGESGGGKAMNNVVAQLLAEMDGLVDNDGVVVVASTNRLDMIDPAILRKGRLDRVIEIPNPDERARADIFRVHLRGKTLAAGESPEQIAARLATITAGFSGADIEAVIMEAGMNALRRDGEAISPSDIELAVDAALTGTRELVAG